MTVFTRLAVICFVACASAQYAEERAPRYIASSSEPKNAPTPVPILKQINRHNEDGSYTYGYEGADGSFKIETKSPAGEVKGKYGYKDDTGKLRVIEYGANKYGFQPAGEGITVAPPTLVDESTREPNKQGGRYRQDDYNDYDEPAPTPAPRPRPTPQPQYRAPQPQYRPAPQPQQQYRPAPTPQPQYNPAPTSQPQYRPAPTPQPQQQYRPNPQTQQYRPQQSAPTPPKPQFFSGAAPAPSQDSFFNPEPAPRQYKPKQDFRPAPTYQDFAPQTPAQTSYTANQFPPQQPRNSQSFSMLDQLLKEYSLPSGGAAATHDITFGSY